MSFDITYDSLLAIANMDGTASADDGDDNAAPAMPMRFESNLYVVDDDNTLYYLVRLLGRGGFGAVFAAVANYAYRSADYSESDDDDNNVDRARRAPAVRDTGFSLRELLQPTHTLKILSETARYAGADIMFRSVDVDDASEATMAPLRERAALRRSRSVACPPCERALKRLGFVSINGSSFRTARDGSYDDLDSDDGPRATSLDYGADIDTGNGDSSGGTGTYYSSMVGENVAYNVRREAYMGAVVRDRVGDDFCRERAVCAEKHFFVGALGVVVFPYVRATSLYSYMEDTLHPLIRRFTDNVRQTSYVDRAGSNMQFDNMTSLLDYYFRLEDEYDARRKADTLGVDDERRFVAFQDQIVELVQVESQLRRVIYSIALQIVRIMTLLHENRIYHGDIKPDNFLISAPANLKILPTWSLDKSLLQVRIIDFGLSCALPLSGSSLDGDFDDNDDDDDASPDSASTDFDDVFRRYAAYLMCDGNYTGTRVYTDPLTRFINANSVFFPVENNALFGGDNPNAPRARLPVARALANFEMYSVAKTLLVLGDTRHITRDGRGARFPIVRPLPLIDERLVALIGALTGEYRYDDYNWNTWSLQDLLRNITAGRPRTRRNRYTYQDLVRRYERLTNKRYVGGEYQKENDPRYKRLLTRRDAVAVYGQLRAMQTVLANYYDNLFDSLGIVTDVDAENDERYRFAQ